MAGESTSHYLFSSNIFGFCAETDFCFTFQISTCIKTTATKMPRTVSLLFSILFDPVSPSKMLRSKNCVTELNIYTFRPFYAKFMHIFVLFFVHILYVIMQQLLVWKIKHDHCVRLENHVQFNRIFKHDAKVEPKVDNHDMRK